MALAESDIEYIKAHLGEWLAEQSLGKPLVVYFGADDRCRAVSLKRRALERRLSGR